MEDTLKNRALFGSLLVVGCYGVSQILRLCGNLVLTRLLAPELFGLMALAQVFISGLELFSDIGLGPSLIRSNRSHDQVFLNTAWTLQVFRGFILWLLTIVIAIPLSIFYSEPLLAIIVPAIGLTCVFSGFNATAIFSLNRDIRLVKLSVMDLSVQILGLALMIALAYFYRNVWAMVAGGLIATAVKMLWSHTLDRTVHNRFQVEKQAVSELLTFGKWIVLSTAMMFLATQADKLLLGKFFQLQLFGIYSIAMALAELPKQVVSQISGKVIFPLIAQYASLPRPTLRQKILQKRKIFLIFLAFMVAVLAIFGDVLIKVLYDERYRQAGWMLPLLALGMWPLLLYVTIDPCLYVVGKPKYPALGNSLKFLYMLLCVPLFYFLAGKFGAVLAVVLNDVPAYIAISIGLKKEGLSAIRQDVWLTACLVGMLLLLLVFRYSLGLDFPGFQAYYS